MTEKSGAGMDQEESTASSQAEGMREYWANLRRSAIAILVTSGVPLSADEIKALRDAGILAPIEP